jgi:hypothetical protein
VHARDEQRAHEWTRKHLVDFRKGFQQAHLPTDAPADEVPDAARTAARVTERARKVVRTPVARSKAR